MEFRKFLLCSLLATGTVAAAAFILSQDVQDFVYNSFTSVSMYFHNPLLRILLDMTLTMASGSNFWSSWIPAIPAIPAPDMQAWLSRLWRITSKVQWFYLWPNPGSSSPVTDNKPFKNYTPKGDGKFKDTAQQLLIPMSYENYTFRDELASKGKTIIKSLPLTYYSENGDCDISEGISIEDFPETVELIADDLGLPEAMKKRIINAARFRDGKTRALERIEFKTDNGMFHFGKIAIVKKEDGFLDMAYSLMTVKYTVNMKVKSSENLKKFLELTNIDASSEADLGSLDSFDFENVDALKVFFQHRAVAEFKEKCEGINKGL